MLPEPERAGGERWGHEKRGQMGRTQDDKKQRVTGGMRGGEQRGEQEVHLLQYCGILSYLYFTTFIWLLF